MRYTQHGAINTRVRNLQFAFANFALARVLNIAFTMLFGHTPRLSHEPLSARADRGRVRAGRVPRVVVGGMSEEPQAMLTFIAENYSTDQQFRISMLAAIFRSMIEADEVIGHCEVEAAMTLVIAEQSAKP